jgi:hypothetical protein
MTGATARPATIAAQKYDGVIAQDNSEVVLSRLAKDAAQPAREFSVPT